MSAPEPPRGTGGVDGGRPSAARARASIGASFVDALRLAAEPSATAVLHAARILSLERAVAAAPRSQRAHLATLIEAALEAEAAYRASVGLPPRERLLFRGWVDLPSSGAAPASETSQAVDRPYLQEVAIPATEVIGVLGASSTEADGLERAWDRLAALAFAACFERPASCRGGRDRRRTLSILWSTLRRRRPAAAAVVRRCVALDRRWRATSKATS